jgi:glycosyltransferase involved in cell wall biosynthesis
MSKSSEVDVLIVTYNSARTLKKCLKSIKEAVPYNRIIVGDGGSNDDTVKIAESEGAEVYQFTGKDNLIGRIRYKLAEKAEKPWILYVDSDVYLYRNFWESMRHLIKLGVGMAYALQDSPARTLKAYLTSRKLGFITFGNTIVPRDLLLMCQGLLNLNGGEDVFFARFAREKGYKIICLKNHLSFHDKNESDLDKTFIRWAESLGKEKRVIKFFTLELCNVRNVTILAVEHRSFADLPILFRRSLKMLLSFSREFRKPN